MYVRVGCFKEDFQFAEWNLTGIQIDYAEEPLKYFHKAISAIPYVSLDKRITFTQETQKIRYKQVDNFLTL